MRLLRKDQPSDEEAQEQPAPFFCTACMEPVISWEPGPGGRPSAKCPHCFSLERHRYLALLLRNLGPVLRTSRRFLQFAPEPQVEQVLRAVAPQMELVKTDLMDARWIDVKADGCQLPFRSRTFDVVVSFHVLEHIPDDIAAMREIVRVLADGGLLVMQVPYRPTALTDEDPDASAEERTQRFGQADHVRYYGKDLNDRLRVAGLKHSLNLASATLSDDELSRFNIPGDNPIWIARAEPSWR